MTKNVKLNLQQKHHKMFSRGLQAILQVFVKITQT